MPRKLLIKPNLTKKNAANCARRVCAILGQLGAEALMEESLTPEFGGCENLRFLPEEAAMEESFACIAIGGDGTIIHAAKSALPWGKPVLGINLGRLGFLAALEPDQLEYLKKLVTGDYQLEERDGVLWLNPGSCGPRRFHQEITMMLAEAADGALRVEKVSVPHGIT